MSMDLPTPPAGTWWDITGHPQGPWTWTSETIFTHDTNGFAVSADYSATAAAPGATATWRGV